MENCTLFTYYQPLTNTQQEVSSKGKQKLGSVFVYTYLFPLRGIKIEWAWKKIIVDQQTGKKDPVSDCQLGVWSFEIQIYRNHLNSKPLKLTMESELSAAAGDIKS